MKMIVNQLSTNSNGQNASSSQQQTQQANSVIAQQQQQQAAHMTTNSINLTQFSGTNCGSTIHVSNQNQQPNTQNYLYQTSPIQTQQTQLYHYQLLKTPPPSHLATLANSPNTLAFQTHHQYTNMMPTDQTNFISQAINFTTKQFDINNNQCNINANFANEHQIYEYMHQLLEEKEKLKELYNEPFSFLLPISAKLLDEGKFYL